MDAAGIFVLALCLLLGSAFAQTSQSIDKVVPTLDKIQVQRLLIHGLHSFSCFQIPVEITWLYYFSTGYLLNICLFPCRAASQMDLESE